MCIVSREGVETKRKWYDYKVLMSHRRRVEVHWGGGGSRDDHKTKQGDFILLLFWYRHLHFFRRGWTLHIQILSWFCHIFHKKKLYFLDSTNSSPRERILLSGERFYLHWSWGGSRITLNSHSYLFISSFLLFLGFSFATLSQIAFTRFLRQSWHHIRIIDHG